MKHHTHNPEQGIFPRLFLGILAVSIAISPVGAPRAALAAEPRPLTLNQALAIAAEKNRDIARAHAYAAYVQGKYVEERSAALPQLALNGTVQASRDESRQTFGSGQRQQSRSMDLTLSQPLYTWGKVSAAIRAAEVGLKTADEQLRLARQGAIRQVTAAFYDQLLADELHRLARENLAQKQRHADEAHRKFAAGVATDYDVLAADVAVANARPEVIRSQNQLKTTRERLRFLLVQNDDLTAEGSLEGSPPSPPTLDEARAIARERRPDLRDLRHRVGIYSELVTIAEAEDKPRLDLKGSSGWHALEVSGMKEDGPAWNVGVHLSFPFFDGLKTAGRAAQARSDLTTRRIEEAQLLDSVDLDIRIAYDGLKEAAEVVTAQTGTVSQAERLVRMAEKGYEFGVKTKLEVDDAQLNLLQAKSSLARARRDHLVARTDLDLAMGVLGE